MERAANGAQHDRLLGENSQNAEYAIVLAIALILQFCAAAAALIYYRLALNWNAEALSYRMKNEYHLHDNDIARSVDELQKQYKCCGAWNYHDWQWSGFENNSKLALSENSKKPSIVPNSCCIGPYPECGKIIHPSNIYYKTQIDINNFWFKIPHQTTPYLTSRRDWGAFRSAHN
ncbi:hypothetical protein ACTXT7_010302 [Hymenolepis weldensis]